MIINWIKTFFNDLFREPKLPNYEKDWEEAERLAKKFDYELADLKVQLIYLIYLLYKMEEKDKNM